MVNVGLCFFVNKFFFFLFASCTFFTEARTRINQDSHRVTSAPKIQKVNKQIPPHAIPVARVPSQTKAVLDAPRAMLEKQEHHVLPAFLVCTAKAKMMMVLLRMVRLVLHVQLGILRGKEIPNAKRVKQASSATPLVPVIAKHVWEDTIVKRIRQN